MSLFSSINNIFSKSKLDQLVGISLQQDSVSLCSVPSLVATASEGTSFASSTIFQNKKVTQLNFSKAINELQA